MSVNVPVRAAVLVTAKMIVIANVSNHTFLLFLSHWQIAN